MQRATSGIRASIAALAIAFLILLLLGGKTNGSFPQGHGTAPPRTFSR